MTQMTTTLSNGLAMPMLGFGTYKLDNPAAAKAVAFALQTGYRHIDTAAFYFNEEGVGQGIAGSGIERQDIFLTTKLWNDDHGYDQALSAFEQSLKRLGTDYVDLYLIHWPMPDRAQSWKALERLYQEGRVKAIGVSNYHIGHLQELLADCAIAPMVNQVEFHPYLVQQPLLDFCQAHSICQEAWSPLMRGQLLTDPLLVSLAEKYGKTLAQIILRWDLQMGVTTIPKSATEARITENLGALDFALTDEDVARITALDKNIRSGGDPEDYR